MSLPELQGVALVSTPQVWGDPTAMFATSENLINLASSYAQQLEDASQQLAAPVINPTFPTVANAPTPAAAALPALETVTWNVPVEPTAFTDQLNVSNLLLGPFTGVAPTLTFGNAPAPFDGTAPTAPITNLNFTYPTVAVTLPSVPSLLTLDTVVFPNITIPSFNVTVPALTAVQPAQFHYVEGSMFTSALLTQLETDLQQALTDGTFTTLTAQAQTALWDRGREREYRAQADALAELDRMESLGYAFPPGVFINARIKIQTETNFTMDSLSREIMIKQAEVQLDNIVKAREAATQLESKLIDYVNQIAQRSFEAAKATADTAVAIYNAQVEAYKASLDAFRTQAQVYDTQIKGLLAQVEVTKAQIEYEKTKADINTAIVAQYKAEVEAAEAVLEIFKTQVEIIQVQAQVEKIKVDIYSAEIQAFIGQINAFTAEVEAYKAQAQTQGVIEDVYKTSVEAYSAQVNAQVAQINAQIAAYRGLIDAYTAQLAGYDSAVKGMIGQAQAASEFNQAQAAVFRAQVEAITSYNGTLTAQWQAVINEQEKVAEIGVQAAKANGDLYIAARGLSLDASKVGAQVAAQLGAAALGAISFHTSSQFSQSTSVSQSTSESDSSSDSVSSSTITEQIASV